MTRTLQNGPDESRAKHVGIVRLSRELLCSLLNFPAGTEIVGVSGDYYFAEDLIALKVTHPDLPEVHECEVITEARPQYRRNLETGEVEFLGWGLKHGGAPA